MKLRFSGPSDLSIVTNQDGSVTITTSAEVTAIDAFVGIAIQTPNGVYGVAQRDGGVEIMHDGNTVFVHTP